MHRAIAERDVEETAVTESEAIDLYREMVRARTFDDRAIALQRRGWMSGYPPFRGQEATQVGVAHAMATTDWLVPTYRSNAAQIARGVPMSDLFAFRKGYAEFQSGHDIPVFPQAVPIATQLSHAVGLGMAARHRGDETAILTLFGDGATSEGDFHEAMNFAGVFDAPVVFCCENNGWAISLPRERQTASETIAQKATAYGFEGKRVDGMDPIAVAECVADALSTARESGPVLIESLTYRLGAHTTSDDPSRYREEESDLPEWRTGDPIERYETYLREHGLLDDETIADIREDADAAVDDAVEHVEAMADPEPDDVFDHVYDRLPAELRRQRSTVGPVGEQN
ncbi:pyruvate dehydrogenase (acetyl-transferring) E1 component subunit alpha [Natranaeroarchaeum aerophilus]|uniref:Pyruvate dehydrogenase (Acetyl-transferring) E1 component subunit alpha n=1 Tax=Natranaeroarchaeum aerophilus TaxID=2917711 RepID=A0AAE3K4T8_9EURY|nr:pyruvate dehydrogenase (acetyl-transferring) E1 component subunit alpha [Natranaeroarchaeum aerophilus]MCL9813508.1 pyruvate dehydrogenase (acetyl-transferring) E1 component subunit alpha [Natranaeroarchaeum aerophilus]